MSTVVDAGFWKGRRVLLTGHTGFKGSWAALWLSAMGAHVFGFARAPDTAPSLYELAGVDADVTSTIGDLADSAALRNCVERARPEIVLHFASQALVRRAYRDPVDTFASNVGGAVNLLEALRHRDGLRAVLIVTTDKVYRNRNEGAAFRETDPLWGEEPYSASKVAQELIAGAYARSYFSAAGIRLATARGGNVIGGGDFAEDRLVPDIVRAIQNGTHVSIRHPQSTRPWQHVLDCLAGYFVYAQALVADGPLPPALNIGPGPAGSLTVADVVEQLCGALGHPGAWLAQESAGPTEAKTLALDVTLAHETLGWSDRLKASAAIEATAAWYGAYLGGGDMRLACRREIEAFMQLEHS
ncbi:CDP-glucose 4,6-dehydratase [Bosea psychrotolerans]|uniref:CDP-glucose 4,6-dehydratase n=1 Tax=Bosea psychrotolerans TaxID=1871628 RepID=A0A2S4LY99_9HYPH|nr:CDP-glucose 4,6-dehydratase [Bosea psychrotolerans]POR47349.1 CDP-glucose 4,6-dehydratase [Bosea psychrotolerans]